MTDEEIAVNVFSRITDINKVRIVSERMSQDELELLGFADDRYTYLDYCEWEALQREAKRLSMSFSDFVMSHIASDAQMEAYLSGVPIRDIFA